MKKTLLLLILLTACATPEQIAEQKRLQDEQDYNTCVDYGFRPHSDGFRNCLLQLDLARQQRREMYYHDSYYYGGYYGPYRHGAGMGYYLGR
jgi:hypothetical protein